MSKAKLLYNQGYENDKIFNLLDGIVMTYMILASGKRQVLDFAFPGAFLGYQMAPDEPMGHTAECITDVAVCVFPKRGFRSLLTRHPDLALRFSELAADDLARMNKYLANLGCRSARKRVAYYLLMLHNRAQLYAPNDMLDASMVLPITQKKLASALGMTNVYINRILHDFQKKGVIFCKGGQVTIISSRGLEHIAETGSELAPIG